MFPYLSTPFPPALPSVKGSCPPSAPLSSFLVQYLRLTQQSIMLWALDAGLPRTLSFIRALKSTDHSLLSSAGHCHLLHYPSHLADDQYEPPPSLVSPRHVQVCLLSAVSLTSGRVEAKVIWESSLSGVGLVWLKPTPEARSHQHADSDRLPSVTRESSSTKEVFVQVITVGSNAFSDRASPACCFLYSLVLKSSSCLCLDA